MRPFKTLTTLTTGLALAAAMSYTGDAGGANLLSNPSFEAPDASGGDVYSSFFWSGFNDVFTTASIPANSGTQSLKIFGPFFPGGGAGAVQSFGAVTPGQTVNASAYAYTSAGDALTPSNFAVVKIEFLDFGNSVIGFNESVQITTANLPSDTWTQFSASGVAPAGTVSAQLVLVHVQQDPVSGGAIFFDDAYADLVPEPTSLALLGLASFGMLRRRRNA